MGLGGDLMYSAVVREINLANRESRVFLYNGKIRNRLLRFVSTKYIRNSSPVFQNNPYLSQGLVGKDDIVIDRGDSNNHYVEKDLVDRYIWRDEKHVVEMVCKNFGVYPKSLSPDLFFSENEVREYADKIILPKEDFIVVEPHGKTDYFSNNRLWFFDRWCQLTEKLSRDVTVIQVGLGSQGSLINAIDLSGQLSFRQAAWLISQSQLLVTTIGGLMHAARAVKKKSVILYAGTERVTMAGYNQNINISRTVDCSPCGLKIPCPYSKKCMDISVNDVYDTILKELDDPIEAGLYE